MVVLGRGSSGLVVSDPRLPIIGENYDDIKNLNQVSKILFEDKSTNYIPCDFLDFKIEYDDIISLAKEYNHIFNSKYFILPIKGGIIDKNKFNNRFNIDNNYNFQWLSNSIANHNIITSLMNQSNDVYQVIYEKGEKIPINDDIFLEKIKNIYEIIKLSNSEGFFFDDIKLDNLIYHNENIKMIDYCDPININLSYEEIIMKISGLRLNYIYYYCYPMLPNFILFYQIKKKELINYDKCFISYRVEILKKLLKLTSIFLPNYKKEINLLNSKNISKISSIEDVKIFSEKKYITMNDYTNSLMNVFLNQNIEKINDVKNIINKIMTLYNKVIKNIYNDKYLDIITFVLTNINLYSFGNIFNDWIYANIKINDSDLHSSNSINLINLEKMLNIIILSCTSYIILNDELYFYFPNLNYQCLDFFFE